MLARFKKSKDIEQVKTPEIEIKETAPVPPIWINGVN